MTETTYAPLQVGDEAPDFTLPTDTGESLRLSDLRGQRVILYFYPQDDTTGCTTQACGLRDAYPAIMEQNAVVLGISPDGVDSHQRFKTKYNLPFTLLVDADHAVAARYGAWGERTGYGKTWTGIIRSQFVIDADGRLIDIQLPIRATASAPRALEILQG